MSDSALSSGLSFVGAGLGAAIGLALAPATGGASALLTYGLVGGAMGLGGGMSAGASFGAAGASDATIEWIRAQRLFEAMIADQQATLMEANLAASMREAELLAGADKINEIMGERERLAIQSAAETSAHMIARQGQALAGQQVVGYHKSGVKLEGTPQAVMDRSRELMEEDIANIMASARYDEINSITLSAMNRIDILGQTAAKWGEGANIAASGRQYLQTAQNIRQMLPFEIWQAEMQAHTQRMQGIGTLFTTLGNLGMKLYNPSGKTVT